MKLKYLIIVLLLAIGFEASAQSFGMGPGLVYLYAGGTSAQLNTNAEFEISPEVLQNYPSISTSIDLEDDLDFPSSSNLFYIKGIVGRRIQLVASYFSLRREGASSLTKTFAFGDNTYSVSAPISGYFNTEYFSASGRISFIHNPIVTAGISAGARYLKLNAGIRADSLGYVFEKDGNLNVPVFVPGLHASVAPIKNLLIRGSFEYFTLSIAGTKGTVTEANFSAEYYFLKYVGVGIGYTLTHIQANDLPDNEIYLRDIDYRVGGPQLFAAFRF